ncbi:MAG: hypothetical protein HY819_24135 [Acidobacteria bacterium]|nr:hypothetical protein [Acidobacteriota bacterium]
MSHYASYSDYKTYNLAYPIDESFPLRKDPIFTEDEWKDIAFWYLNVEQKTITELEIALANEDFYKLMVLGDQIYGHGGSFGFHSISLYGKNIEVAAINKDTVLLAYLISCFKSYTKHLLLEIHSSNFNSNLASSAASC